VQCVEVIFDEEQSERDEILCDQASLSDVIRLQMNRLASTPAAQMEQK
jgi:hypothetical protein